MCNNCNCNKIKATEIIVEPGIVTINVPEDTVWKDGCNYCICLFKSIPADADSCPQVIVNNGTVKLFIETCNGNYWRPCKVNCRSILETTYYDDPEHLVIRNVKR